MDLDAELLEEARAFEEYFSKNGISEAELTILDEMALGKNVIPNTIILGMIVRGEIEVFINPKNGETAVRRTSLLKKKK